MSTKITHELRTFEVGFKEYYYEYSNAASVNIKARDEQDALRRFAKRYGITHRSADPDKWEWSDGDWLCRFRYVKLATTKVCPHCEGSGIVLL